MRDTSDAPGEVQDAQSEPGSGAISKHLAGVPLIVGIGASAGGLEAFKTFFSAMRADTGMAFVLIQHLDPTAESQLAELIAGYTTMAVRVAVTGTAVDPDTIYVIPPDAVLTIGNRRLCLVHPATTPERRVSVSTFLTSLALDQGENAVGIILSGFGSDGVEGIAKIKEHGGLTLSQAEFDHHAKSGMPQSATAAGFVDHVLPVGEMPAALVNYQHHRTIFDASLDKDGIRRDLPAFLPAICAALHTGVGRDFRQYKTGTLMRRIQRRMHVLQIEDVPAYIEQVRTLANEADILSREFLVSVTQFFRDPAAFSALDAKVIAAIVASRDEVEPVRIWVAACTTGEEAYSIAILLFERMAATGRRHPVQIFATDVDDRAIEVARSGRYPASIASTMSAQILETYFVKEGDSYQVTKALRDACLFSTHDLVKDPPFSRLDLVSCRNLLIYLQVSLQEHVFTLFHYALRPGCCLFLGQSETVPVQSRHFSVLDKQHRLFTRRDTPARFPSFLLSSLRARPSVAAVRQAEAGPDAIERQAARQLARYNPAFVIVDRQNDIVRVSGQTGLYLDPGVGTAALKFFTLLNPDLRPAARRALTDARNTGKRSFAEGIGTRSAERGGLVNLFVEALQAPQADGLYMVAFQHVPAPAAAMQRDLPLADVALVGQFEADTALARLERLLRTTRERLHASTEELETVTEELQSSNQEYLAVNEELQSANEELETSKEELQSLNEELQTTNVELSHRNDSLIRSNSDLANMFDSTAIATLFLDSETVIRRFTPRLVEIFNVRDGDEGRPISDIATKLASTDILTDVRTVLRTQGRVEREVISISGVAYLMQIRPYRDLNNTVNGAVVSFIDISERKQHEQARARLAGIVESSQDGIISHDLNGLITSWNTGAQLLFGYTAEDAIGIELSRLIRNPDAAGWQGSTRTAETSQPSARFDSVAVAKDGREVEVSVTISPLRGANGHMVGASVIARDISERRAADRKTVLLLGELDHRVKNILAIVSAVISQTLSTGLTPEAFAAEVEGRIQAVAKAHSLLTHAGSGTMSVRDVILTELAPYNDKDTASRLSVSGVDVDLTPKAGMAIAMAIHELTSNAAKYGALSTPAGHLSVAVFTSSGADGVTLNLVWTEANGPKVAPPTRRGFGTSLIERALTYELDAEVTRRFDPTGVVCNVAIPLTEEVGHVQRGTEL